VAASYAALPRTGETADEPPRIPLPARAAAALGADNDRVLELIEKRFTAC
jgi:hypothetical protein